MKQEFCCMFKKYGYGSVCPACYKDMQAGGLMSKVWSEAEQKSTKRRRTQRASNK